MILRRLGALFLGLLLALVVAEASLRLLGVAYFLPVQASRGGANEPDALPGSETVKEGAVRILCLGNSHTQGYADDVQSSYPRELEDLLRARFPGKKFQVINTGRGNSNSSEILESIPRILAKYRPHVVFAMIGEPNAWNYRYYYKFKGAGGFIYDHLRALKIVRLLDLLRHFDARGDIAIDPEPPIPQLTQPAFEYPMLASAWIGYLEAHPALDRVPLGELAQASVAMHRWAAHPRAKDRRRLRAVIAEIDFYLGNFGSGLEAAESLLAIPGERFDIWLWRAVGRYREKMEALHRERAGRILAELEARAKAVKLGPGWLESLEGFLDNPENDPGNDAGLLEKFLSVTPGESRICDRLASLQKNKHDLSSLAETYISCARENPYGQFGRVTVPDLSPFPPRLARRIQDQVLVPTTAQEPFGGVFGENARKADEGFLSASELDQETANLHRWVADDLRKVIEVARDHGLKVVMQTYPPYRASRRERWPDSLIRSAAREKGATLSDTSGHFRRIFAAEPSEPYFYKEGRAFQDDHLNRKGNQEVAKLMLRQLEELGFLK